jgi:hypothetical protein
MSYNLNIIRQDDWSDYDAESTISLDEWIMYAENDPELELDTNQKIFIKCYKWNAYPYSNEIAWFAYNNGSVFTKNPDFYVIKKMISIASALNGKVRGEEHEFYDEDFLMNFK